MNSKLLLPMIFFLLAFILIIIGLVVCQGNKKKKFKHEIEDLDIEKNKLVYNFGGIYKNEIKDS